MKPERGTFLRSRGDTPDETSLAEDELLLSGQPPLIDNGIIRLIIGAVTGLLIVSLLHPNASPANPIPWPWMIGGIVGGALHGLFAPLPSYISGILIRPADLEIHRTRKPPVTLLPADISLVTCAGGLTLDGGPLIVPRFVRLWTSHGFYSIRLDNEEALPAFDHLARACPRAILIPYEGKPTIPPRPRNAAEAPWRRMIESSLSREFRQQARSARLAGVVALIVGAGLLTVAIVAMVLAPKGSSEPTLAVHGIIALCAGFAFLIRSIGIARRGRRSLRAALVALDPIAAAHAKLEDDEPDPNASGPQLGKILLWAIGLLIGAFVLILALIIAGVI